MALYALAGFADAWGAAFRLGMDSPPPGLTVGQIDEPGALFIFQAPDLLSLRGSPSVFFKTNTPVAAGLWTALPAPAGTANGGFFFGVQWPGRSVGEFGDPEYAASAPAPAWVLFTQGLPGNLVTGQVFSVGFFLTDPAGRMAAFTGAAEIAVLRRSDGTVQPGVQASPATVGLAGGYGQAQVSLEGAGPLEGCVAGLRPAGAAGFVAAVFDLGAGPVPVPAAGAVLQTLESRRLAAADKNQAWGCPLPGGVSFAVGGTYGEWRGADNLDVHEGLDLVAGGSTHVVASRGGMVSWQGTLPGQGDYLVIDHGDGWFSRYLGLDGGSVAVTPGQAVARGATLAGALFTAAGWRPHVHFEVRQGDGSAQWGVVAPGSSQDPLQAAATFAVPGGTAGPAVEAMGLSGSPPGLVPFTAGGPGVPGAPGQVYLFARLVDAEAGNLGPYRLGLRSMTFQADGMSQRVEIRPATSAAIELLRPPGTGMQAGFAKYGPLQAAEPDPLNWYQYWWTWNTAAYASVPEGPRTFVLIGQSYSGLAATNTFSFGPEIQGNVWEPLGSGAFQATLVAHLGSSNGGPNVLAQPDQYRLEVLHSDGTSMAGVQWEGLGPGSVTRIFTSHLDTAVVTFQIPATESPTNMMVRATSLLAPDLRHEVTQGVVALACRFNPAPALADIPAGTFVMGSPASEPERAAWEGPQTQVTISYCFKMGRFEVTQGQWQALMTNNPSYYTGNTNLPVEQVTWAEATNYCYRLTLRERQSGCLPAGWAYRLPTEAEWEYACRAGSTNAFAYGTALRSGMANFDGHFEYNSSVGTISNALGVFVGQTVPVGRYAPNAWGLYDVHGNTWEWCLDGWSYNLPGGSVTNLVIAAPGAQCVIRGGGWYNEGKECRAAYRLPCTADYGTHELGFRVVLAPQGSP